MGTEVVVLTYNHWDLTHQLLMDLKDAREHIDAVTVVDNGSTDEDVKSGLKFWKNTRVFNNLFVVDAIKNRGFVGGANFGLRTATYTNVILLSNDVRLKKGWIENVVGRLDSASENENVLIGAEYYNMDTGWNTFDGKVFPYLAGYALATTNAGWQSLGGFDERYAPYDFEDVDLSTTAISLGFKLEVIPGVIHKGGGTIGYNPEREAQTKINQKKFEEKWIRKQS